MMSPRMMGRFPPWGYDWTFSDFYDAVTRAKSNGCRGFDKFNVRPLKTVSMYIVSNFAE